MEKPPGFLTVAYFCKTDPMTNHPKLTVKSKKKLLLVSWNDLPNDAIACELLMTRPATFKDWAQAETIDVGKKSSLILYNVESGIYCLKLKIVMTNNITIYSNEEYACHIYTEKAGCSSVPSSLKDYISSSYSSERVTSVTPSSTSFSSNASTASENSFIEQRKFHMLSSTTSASSSTDNILEAVDHDNLEDEKDNLLKQAILAIKELKKEVDQQKAKVVILEDTVLDQEKTAEKTSEMFKKENAKVLILEELVLHQEKSTEILKKEHEEEKTAYDNLLQKAMNKIMKLQKKRSSKGGKKKLKKSVKPAPSATMTELKELLESLKT